MGHVGSKKKITKDDLKFLVKETKFSKKEILLWNSAFCKDCPSGICKNESLIILSFFKLDKTILKAIRYQSKIF